MDYLLYIRGAERLLVASSGLVSLVLGYGLFRLTYTRGARSEAEMVAKGGGFELSIKNAWPGVFFAAFGMVILVTSVLTQLKIPGDVTATDLSKRADITYGMGGAGLDNNATKARKAIIAINEILLMEVGSAASSTPQRDEHIAALAEAQVGLVDVVYGPGSFAHFNDITSRVKVPGEFEKMSKKDQVFFEDLRSITRR